MMKQVLGLLICLGSVLPITPFAWAAEDDQEDLDVILRTDDARPTRTKITVDDYITVEGRVKLSAVKLPSYKVADVLRADRPQEYDRGMERHKEGRYAVAAKYFTDVLRSKDQKNKPWVVEYCNYRLGEAMFEGQFWDGYKGKTYTYSPPADYYEAVLKANPKSRFLLDASVKLPICLIEQKKFAEAEKAFVAALAAIKQFRDETARTADMEYRGLAERSEAMLKLGNARLFEKKGDFGQATEMFMSVQRLAKKYPAVYAEAVDGELRCLVKQNKFAEAKARADALIKRYQETSDPSLVAMLPGAYTVMGRASLAMAGDFEVKNNGIQAQQAYSDARWNYLQVLVQFFDREEYLEEASYFVGLCYDKLKDQEPTGKDMAIRYWLNVKRSYPDGSFAKQADQDLARAGYNEPKKEELIKETPKKEEPKKTEPVTKAAAGKGGGAQK